jgi:hypothetical protein
VSRVFNLKLKEEINLLSKGQLFGHVKFQIYRVEWQKRRLPQIDSYLEIFQENVVGHPSNTQRFYLRLLLHNIKGPTSYEALKIINNTVHPTYQSACKL